MSAVASNRPILWVASIDLSTNVLANDYVRRHSIDTRLIHQSAIDQEDILVEHPPMSASILTTISLVAYWSTAGQLLEVYWSNVGPV